MSTNSSNLGPATTVRFHAPTLREIKRAARRVRLSEANTVRKATELGLPLLLEALGVKRRQRKQQPA